MNDATPIARKGQPAKAPLFAHKKLTIAERMAAVMREYPHGCTTDDLQRRGFHINDIEMHQAHAAQLARSGFVRDDTPPPYDRAARLRQAADVVQTLLPHPHEVDRALVAAGFTRLERCDLTGEATSIAAGRFANGLGA